MEDGTKIIIAQIVVVVGLCIGVALGLGLIALKIF